MLPAPAGSCRASASSDLPPPRPAVPDPSGCRSFRTSRRPATARRQAQGISLRQAGVPVPRQGMRSQVLSEGVSWHQGASGRACRPGSPKRPPSRSAGSPRRLCRASLKVPGSPLQPGTSRHFPAPPGFCLQRGGARRQKARRAGTAKPSWSIHRRRLPSPLAGIPGCILPAAPGPGPAVPCRRLLQ